MYNDHGLVDGAQKYFDWLESNRVPYVFLSNSASKGPPGVQHKFITPPWNISSTPINLVHAMTAAEAVARFLVDRAPPNSRLYILQSTATLGKFKTSCATVIQHTVPGKLFNTWEWRTDMSFDEIHAWASDKTPVFVVNCVDGQVEDLEDPVTHRPGYKDWSYELLSKATRLLLNGATLVSSAPDKTTVPSLKGTVTMQTPGPGGLHTLLQTITYPSTVDRVFLVGKGGSDGTKYAMQPAIELLRKQGFTGTLKNVAMVGDTLYTDILAGVNARTGTVFVTSGADQPGDEKYYPDAKPMCTLPNVGHIPMYVALKRRRAK
eukprot:NODE_1072_length_1294_cov_120.730924_g881_i0.p1 GENE.NODE_1072_length_1294_cov_120.730924_g881_i0~~NODE_1072_length_1294_cov_120.730924_g881_i0.p1  ORF type:complete len:357 (+),score=107.05 NODE_1072_length_1294_cov_120.730924_g881_i0:113-1072(+)